MSRITYNILISPIPPPPPPFVSIFIVFCVLSESLSLHSRISTSLLMLHLVTFSCVLCCHFAFEKDSARVETSCHLLLFAFIPCPFGWLQHQLIIFFPNILTLVFCAGKSLFEPFNLDFCGLRHF